MISFTSPLGQTLARPMTLYLALAWQVIWMIVIIQIHVGSYTELLATYSLGIGAIAYGAHRTLTLPIKNGWIQLLVFLLLSAAAYAVSYYIFFLLNILLFELEH